MQLTYLANLGRYIPELIACVTMVGLILLEATYNKDEKDSKGYIYWGAIIGLGFSLKYLIENLTLEGQSIFTNSLVIDSFSTLAKIVMVLGTIACVYLGKVSKDIYEGMKGEFVIIIVGVLVGGMLLASANNMLTLYLGIETLSILSYALAAMKRNDEKSSEAGLKYSLYGGISAGLMLFGMSHIFGVLGTIQFTEILPLMSTLTDTQVMILLPSFLLFFAGIGYKVACVPFHMWSPDVYEGSPLPVTAFFSIVPKIAGIVALTRITNAFFGGDANAVQITWVGTMTVIAALTMTVGNISAIGQRSVKRMLAFSSISHAGVMLASVLVINEIGNAAVLFYAVTYLFMTMVAFYIVSFIQDETGSDHFERFNGLLHKHPIMAIVMTITMFSLAGLPPLSGFVAKFNVLTALVSKEYYTLAVVAGVNSVIALYYYMKIVRFMIFKPVESEEKVAGFTTTHQVMIFTMCIPVLLLGIFWNKLMILSAGAKLFQ